MTLRVPLNCGVTILGDFLKYLAINFRAKKAQIFGKFLGYLTFLGKNCSVQYFGQLLKFFGYFSFHHPAALV